MSAPLRTIITVLSASVVLSLAGCQGGAREPSAGSLPDQAPQSKVNAAQEANSIMGLEREWSRRFQVKDIDWIMTLYTEESRMFPPGGEPVTGLEALRAAWQSLADTKGLEITWEPTEAHVAESGDMAWDIGDVIVFSPDGMRQTGKYLVVWKRENGNWKVSVNTYNENSPPGG
jgi:ketosteroid isomerase-like protein